MKIIQGFAKEVWDINNNNNKKLLDNLDVLTINSLNSEEKNVRQMDENNKIIYF